MDGITAEQLMSTIGVILTVFAALVTVDRVVEIVKKWRAPSSDIAKKLDTDKRRLDTHDRVISDLRDGQEAMCSGVLALLDHALHNGNTEQMQSAHREIMKYLKNHIGDGEGGAGK